MTYIKRELWTAELEDWLITDCAVRTRDIIHLCMRRKTSPSEASLMFDHDIFTSLFSVYFNTPDAPYGRRMLTGYNKPKLGVALATKGQALLVAGNEDGQVSVFGGGGPFADESIDAGKWPLTNRVKCINGYAYSVGDRRKIYKRVDVGRWVPFGSRPKDEDRNIAHVGFNDMDAFPETDMYAVGGHGDVWHYDGKVWKQMGFPSNVQLATVTCAGDGHVYISGEGGSLWVGSHSTWKRVHQGTSTILWNDVLWFDGRLWLASDYQLRVWDGKAMQTVQNEGRDVSIYGHMDARDGLLVVASPHDVMSFNGSDWQTIVAPYTT